MIVCLRKDAAAPNAGITTMSDQSASRLLSLPAELRIAIWSFILVLDLADKRKASIGALPNTHAVRRQKVCANILRTCKQAHKEGTPILYGDNTFLAHSSLLASLPAFLLQKTPTRVLLAPVKHRRVADLIRRYYIYVRLDVDPRFTKLQVQESFTGVEELEIEVFQAMYGSCDFSVLRLFEGVRDVKKVKIFGSVGDGRYAEWLARCMMSPPDAEVPEYDEEAIGSTVWHAWVHGNR